MAVRYFDQLKSVDNTKGQLGGDPVEFQPFVSSEPLSFPIDRLPVTFMVAYHTHRQCTCFLYNTVDVLVVIFSSYWSHRVVSMLCGLSHVDQ